MAFTNEQEAGLLEVLAAFTNGKRINDLENAQGALKDGELMDVVVPTGNFGNILAAHYAKMIGTPIDRLVCASNKNKVLFDFFRTKT